MSDASDEPILTHEGGRLVPSFGSFRALSGPGFPRPAPSEGNSICRASLNLSASMREQVAPPRLTEARRDRGLNSPAGTRTGPFRPHCRTSGRESLYLNGDRRETRAAHVAPAH